MITATLYEIYVCISPFVSTFGAWFNLHALDDFGAQFSNLVRSKKSLTESMKELHAHVRGREFAQARVQPTGLRMEFMAMHGLKQGKEDVTGHGKLTGSMIYSLFQIAPSAVPAVIAGISCTRCFAAERCCHGGIGAITGLRSVLNVRFELGVLQHRKPQHRRTILQRKG